MNFEDPTPGLQAHLDGDVSLPRPFVRRFKWYYRVGAAVAAFALVVLIGAVSIYFTGEEQYSFLQALYFSLVTVSTVGYGELPHLASHPWARAVAAGTIVLGVIVLAFFQSTLTALFLEGVFSKAIRRRRMDKRISKLENHYILVGCGRVGHYVASELRRAGHHFVVIEHDGAAIQHLESVLHDEVLSIEGDATDDEVLINAGIHRAAGLVTTLSLDRDNLFVTLSARTMNADLRIIAKVANAQNEGKLLRAGASTTVSPQQIGGIRLANELARPHVTEFFDRMLHMPDEIRFHELLVTKKSAWCGKQLKDSGLRAHGNLLVIAFRFEDGTYRFNPGPNERLDAGVQLIILGPSDQIRQLQGSL